MSPTPADPSGELLDGADGPSVSDVEDMSTDEDEESDKAIEGTWMDKKWA